MGKQPKPRKGLKDLGQHRRILILMALLGLLAFVPVALQLWDLMIRQYDYYSSLALKNQLRTTLVPADRGNIYDRNRNLLAGSQEAPDLYLAPRELKQADMDIPALSKKLGELLGKDPQWIEQKAGNIGRRYERIGRSLEQETAEKIRAYIGEDQLRGIHLEPGTRRIYPFGTLAAQVIGFTDASGQGVEGIELAYDSFLRGGKSRVLTTKGNNEMDLPFSYEAYLNSRPGCSLILTLDTTVQSILENELQKAVDRYQVSNGAFGLVMNCKTGEILAMATLGAFDPNEYQKILDPAALEQLLTLQQAAEALPEGSDSRIQAEKALQEEQRRLRLKQWRNRVIADGYEPGSTFKVLTMAAALDCGAIDLNTDFYCSGAEQIPGRAQLLHCWRHQGHGAEKTPEALQNSCNIAFAHIALRLGGERFYDYIQRFGVTEKTGIDLKGESRGVFFDRALITDTEKWGTASLTSGSFGQTFKLTPLQLVRAIASVVNGGRLLEPYLVSEVQDPEGKTVYRQEPTVIRHTVSEETSTLMCGLIRSVVTSGTARNAAVKGFDIGGKTGTSEKIDVFDENGRRVTDKIVSFVGVAPMNDPEYIVLAALDTPSRSCGTYLSGGAMAAPTVGAILEELLPYLEVPREEVPTVILPDCEGLPGKTALQRLKQLEIQAVCQGEGDRVTGQIPAGGQKIPSDSQILLYFGETPAEGLGKMPDFQGLDREQAEILAAQWGFCLELQGNENGKATVLSQSPEPGEALPPDSTVILKFTDRTVQE